MKFNILTLGCKVNAYESEMIKEKLISSGYFFDTKNPDIIIVNTCSVTNTADSKSLKLVRRLKRENENAVFVVCGCSVQNDKEKFKELGVEILLGNKGKSEIVSLIEDYLKKHTNYECVTDMQKCRFEDMKIDRFNHIRAYIKIQDGCNNYCSYCVIPYLRGNLRSKDFETILAEAKDLVNNGHKEIVLTGIHTGSYNDNGKDLFDLINELSQIDNLKRIRLSSIEITEINNDKFYNLLKNNNKLCNHLHIPLQAGSDEVLKRMNRKYDLDYYENVINKIRSIRPDISITTDCLVGHPYETEELFLNTLEFCKKIKFSKIHVFPYSVRKGTAASRMPNQVNEKDKKSRADRLIKLSNELEKEYYDRFIDKKLEVLIEEKKDNFAIGHTSNMLKLTYPSKKDINDFEDIIIKRNYYE